MLFEAESNSSAVIALNSANEVAPMFLANITPVCSADDKLIPGPMKALEPVWAIALMNSPLANGEAVK